MKFAAAILIYVLAFAAHLFPILALRKPTSYEDWLQPLAAFGGKPFKGTEALIATLDFWWLYPLVALVVFGYFLVMRRKLLWPTLFMVSLALLWWTYFYGPYILIGPAI